jgi:hypothetical protein
VNREAHPWNARKRKRVVPPNTYVGPCAVRSRGSLRTRASWPETCSPTASETETEEADEDARKDVRETRRTGNGITRPRHARPARGLTTRATDNAAARMAPGAARRDLSLSSAEAV